jgi:hypothetical protein
LYVGEAICYTNNFFWQQDFQTAEEEKSAENKGLLLSPEPQKFTVIQYL